ncbi:uncharacterized protein PHALS_11327 [Plasmopara halstedii]|uniref:Ankyrin repeat-containing domain n=1 Tax=Plasmopara halstedii TaxID=4781 RepID=A0A0P1AJ08_PLAHL|nr:uncharacterized protein PHALS_11327 [Plasmopara halstedii]CEG41165.1 hypothetical protein PHALS_11327 [Plasmopara halstedii]|eukprot:XP_024577534.1 hypothetical protein PHALS_11327 [Plasmopara halstedii]
MGNAVALESVAESSRRRMLMQQYNCHSKDYLVANTLMQAFEQRRLCSIHSDRASQTEQDSRNIKPLLSLPLHDIYDVLKHKFGVQLSLEELPIVLQHLGCRVVESSASSSTSNFIFECYTIDGLVEFIAPRRILRQSKSPTQCSYFLKVPDHVTIWHAAKMGDLEIFKAICTTNIDTYRSLDDFENSSLYYASLCGREVIVDFIIKVYEQQNCKICSNEFQRCVTNALTPYTRALLQQKMTLCEVLDAKKHDKKFKDDYFEDEPWFGMMDDNE